MTIPADYWCESGHVNRVQAAELGRLARSTGARVCLEIGFATGRSLAAVYFEAQPLRMVSIDRSLDYMRGGRQMAERMQQLPGVTILEQDSRAIDWDNFLADYLDNALIDFAFVDGDHSYIGCSQDLFSVLPLMNKGGMIVVDDYRSGPPDGVKFDEVIQAVDDFVSNFSLHLTRWNQNGKGMAVITGL